MSRQSRRHLSWLADSLAPDSVVAGWFWPAQLAFRRRKYANRLRPRARRGERKRLKIYKYDPLTNLPF